ncbi:hypothetical protein Snov_4351 [Ancylobacter novellus DSM 506]|uniref:Uncharacterized protein n=1 Tax=Ancylobacter novellus (strain ATCC 8093 / DSM 506 / JCM 20403 / CCM 1077 / IAM 12100 / NBRC 12443 / NCIMB 10456) TaxID=639283 RepID=D6ZZB2_ANCN5|nr:hypothetical protein [Ancylobacter novellus]ADH89248.1 hypothetical protein Snov_1948 [Ancylobacter novellus DSM 506]ADH91610.1 hypothetical protein Snov_4351 [Ancylobacter novellus DSM 506]
MTIHTPTPRLVDRATETEVRIICERQIAAKICGMLPADENSAQRILANASKMFEQFLSLEAVRADWVEG